MQQVCCVNHMCSLHLQISWWRVDVFDMYRFSVFTAFVSFILTYRLLALQQISRLCLAVLCRLLQSVLTCHDTCGLVLCAGGSADRDCGDSTKAMTTEMHVSAVLQRGNNVQEVIPLCEDRCQLSEFLQKLLFDFYLSFRFFYYCILILHRFSFILWILINTLQNDNKPSWILKYLHKCKIQKVRRNWILQMVLETTMMQDKKQAGSKNWNMARKPTKRQTLNRKTSTEGGAKCNITNGHAHCDATWLASCAMTPQAQHFPHDGDWNCVLIG